MSLEKLTVKYSIPQSQDWRRKGNLSYNVHRTLSNACGSYAQYTAPHLT